MNGTSNFEDYFIHSRLDIIERYNDFCFKRELSDEFYSKTWRLAACGVPFQNIALIYEKDSEPLEDFNAKLLDPVKEEEEVIIDVAENMFQPFIYNYMNNGESFKKGHSLMLFGPNSSGKTFISTWMLSHAIISGKTGLFILFDDLYKNYNKYHNGNYEEDTKYILDFAKNCDFLVIDEMGKDNASETLVVFMEKLLKYRSNHNLTTVICTNMDLRKRVEKELDNWVETNDFLSRYGNSCWQILLEKYHFFQFSNKSNFREKTRLKWGF
tara:strand:+ start:14320 stop:15126 length:807 start_codon:yes stop_codon:yes gene_type:complete